MIAHDPLEPINSRVSESGETSRYDGTGHTIDIPTLILDQEDGEKLWDVLSMDKSGSGIILESYIEVINEDKQQISYSLFYGSVLDLPVEEIREFYNY